MNQTELSDHELDQATGGSINPTSSVIDPSPSVTNPTPGFRWRLRLTDPTEG